MGYIDPVSFSEVITSISIESGPRGPGTDETIEWTFFSLIMKQMYYQDTLLKFSYEGPYEIIGDVLTLIPPFNLNPFTITNQTNTTLEVKSIILTYNTDFDTTTFYREEYRLWFDRR